MKVEINMREFMQERKIVPKIVGLGLAATALVGCGNKTADSWVFNIKCPVDTSVDVTGITNYGSIDLHCSSDAEPTSPNSIELMSGEGITINDDGEVRGDILTVDYSYMDGGLNGVTPLISQVQIFEESAKITTQNVNLTGVHISGRGK